MSQQSVPPLYAPLAYVDVNTKLNAALHAVRVRH